MKKQEKIWVILVALLMMPGVLAAAEYTQTIVQFNIASTLAYTLTLLGESAVNSDPTAATAPTTDIYFNSTTGDEKGVEAQVVAGTQQSAGSPIFQFTNTGTVNISLSLFLNATEPSCVSLMGNNTYRVTGNGSQEIGITNTSIDTEFSSNEGTIDYYLWANFTSCYGGNYYRELITAGEQI